MKHSYPYRLNLLERVLWRRSNLQSGQSNVLLSAVDFGGTPITPKALLGTTKIFLYAHHELYNIRKDAIIFHYIIRMGDLSHQ